MSKEYGVELQNGIKILPQSPRCDRGEPRGKPPTAARQSEPQCPTSGPEYKYDLPRVLCLSRYFFVAQRNGITQSFDVPWKGIVGLRHGSN